MGRLYVLCSNKLDPIYAAVQGGHAIAEFLIDQEEAIANRHRSVYREDKWYNDTVVYLTVDIDEWEDYLDNFDHLWFYYSKWREPDVGNELTAIALNVSDDFIDWKSKKLSELDNLEGIMIPAHKRLLKKLKSEKLLGSSSLDKELQEIIENPS